MAIDIKELRVGNWVQNDIGYQWQLNSFAELYDHLERENTQQPEPFPIPLTPEILEKAGFDKDRNGFSLPDKMSLSFSVTKDGEYLSCWLDKSLGIVVKYVHQLQNLYFCLTGEEVNYNPITLKQENL